MKAEIEEYSRVWDFDGEILTIFYYLDLRGDRLLPRVRRIISQTGIDIPRDSPLFVKASQRFEGSHRSGKLMHSTTQLKLVSK